MIGFWMNKRRTWLGINDGRSVKLVATRNGGAGVASVAYRKAAWLYHPHVDVRLK